MTTMDKCCNEDLASAAGMDKPLKTPVDVYDQKNGKYTPMSKPTPSTEPAPSTVSPFKLTGK